MSVSRSSYLYLRWPRDFTIARDALPIFLYMKHAPVRVPLMNRLGMIKCIWFLGYVSCNKATKKVSNAVSLGS